MTEVEEPVEEEEVPEAVSKPVSKPKEEKKLAEDPKIRAARLKAQRDKIIAMKNQALDQELEDSRNGKSDNEFCNTRLKEFLDIDKNVRAGKPQAPIDGPVQPKSSKNMRDLFKDDADRKKEEEAKMKLERNRDIMKRIKQL